MAEREEIMKLGVDASQVTPALRRIIESLGQYNRTIGDVSNATVRFNRQGAASRITLTSIDKAGNALTQTFKLLKNGIQQTSAALTENKNAQEKALREMVRNQEFQHRQMLVSVRMERQQTADFQAEVMRRLDAAKQEQQRRAQLYAAMRRDEEQHRQAQIRAARVAARDAAVAAASTPRAQFLTGLRSGFLRAGPPLLTGAVAAGSGQSGSIMGGLGGLTGGLVGTAATMAVGTAISTLTSIVGRMARAWAQATIDAAEFQRQIALIRTISQDAQLNMTQWQDGVIRLSNAFGRTKEEIATGVYETLSSQIATGADSFVFMEQAMKLAVATGSEARQSVHALAGALNAYHMRAAEAEKVSAIFFKAIDIGNGTLGAFSDNIGRVAQPAAQLGVDIRELAFAWAILTKNGMESHTAWTVILNLLLQLRKPSEDMQRLFRQWGVETANQLIAAERFVGVLQRMQTAMDNGDASIEQMLPELRAMNGGIGLTGQNLEELRHLLAETTDIELARFRNGVDETRKVAGQRFAEDMETLKNTLHELGDTTLRLAYVFKNHLLTAVMAVSPTTAIATMQLAAWHNQLRAALPIMEAAATLMIGGMGTGPSAAQQEKDRVAGLLRARFEAMNEHANKMRAKFFEMADSEKAALQETKDAIKSKMEVHQQAFEQLNQNLEQYIRNLEKSRRSLNEVANEIRNIRASNFNDTRSVAGMLETTDPAMRAQIDRIFLNNPVDISNRLGSLMSSIRSGQWFNNPEGIRADFQELRGLWQEQIAFQAEVFNRTQDVRVLQSIRDIQNLINQSRWDELRIIENLAAADQRRAAAAQKVLDEDRVKVREMRKLTGRLDELKPEDFRDLKSATEAFDRIATPLINKARTMSSAEAASLATTLEQQREMFLSQVRQHQALDQLTQAQSKLQEAFNKATQEIQDKGFLMSDSFMQAEQSIHRATQALVTLKQEMADLQSQGLSGLAPSRAAFDAANSGIKAKRTQETANATAAQQAFKQMPVEQQAATAASMLDPTYNFDPIGAIMRWGAILSDPYLRQQFIGFNSGGYISGRGGIDANLIAASDGEFMLNSRATRMFYPQIVAMNMMGLGGGSSVAGGDTTTFGDIHVTVNGERTPDATARSIGQALRRELRRGTVKLPRR